MIILYEKDMKAFIKIGAHGLGLNIQARIRRYKGTKLRGEF